MEEEIGQRSNYSRYNKSWTNNLPAILRNPKSTRPWQHVLEPLSGYLLLAYQLNKNHSSINGTSFNFGPSSDVIKSVEDLIDEMSKYWKGSSKELPKKQKISMNHLYLN